MKDLRDTVVTIAAILFIIGFFWMAVQISNLQQMMGNY